MLMQSIKDGDKRKLEPPSKELARLGEKIEWINKDDFICFHCAQKQGQANREEEEPSMYLSYTEWKPPKRMKADM